MYLLPFNFIFYQELGTQVSYSSLLLFISLLISNVFLLGASCAYLSECGFYDDKLLQGWLKDTDLADWAAWSIAGNVFLMLGCLAAVVYKFVKNQYIVYAYAGLVILGWILVTISMFIGVSSDEGSFDLYAYNPKKNKVSTYNWAAQIWFLQTFSAGQALLNALTMKSSGGKE